MQWVASSADVHPVFANLPRPLLPAPFRSRGGGGGWRADDRRQRLLAMLEEGEDEDVDWDALAIKARKSSLVLLAGFETMGCAWE